MQSDLIVVSDDDDFRRTSAAQELSAVAGIPLAQTYPGYNWRITPHPHPTKPFIDIQLEHGGNCMVGATVKPWQFPTASMLKKEILKLGGELLELFHLNRRAFDETEFVSREKNFAGVIVPDGFAPTRSNASTRIIVP